MEEQPNYFCQIPADVRYDKELSASEKLFYGEITALTHVDGRCWASRSYFADLYGVDERTISRWTTKLAEKGYIEVRVVRNKNNEILRRNIAIKKFSTPRDKNVPCGGQKCPYPSDKNVAENNTSINNKERKKESTYDEILKTVENAELRNALLELVKARKLLKKPLTNRALELLIGKLNKIGSDDCERIAIVNQSIENGWAGVFPLKEDKQSLGQIKQTYQQTNTNVYRPYGMPSNFGLWQPDPVEAK